MAGLETSLPGEAVRRGIASPLARRQYAALAWMQSRVFLNSLRTRRGSFELGARILTSFLFALLAIGPAIGMGMGAYLLASDGHLRSLALPLWILTLMWQFFSALAPTLAGQNPDLSHLLRFPVSFGSWILLYLLYGVVAPSTLIGLLWTAAIGIGATMAHPEGWAWVTLTLVVFALFNLLLSRTILAWIERWMAQRRSREIVTGIFLLFALFAQIFNPAFHEHRRGLPYGLTRGKIVRLGHQIWEFEKVLPPGLAAESIAESIRNHPLQKAEDLGWVGIYAVAVAGLLTIRLRDESRGENFSEAPRRVAVSRAGTRKPARSWLAFSGPVAAVFEKDLRYLLRSGPMLYNLASPLVMVFLFGGMAGSSYGRFSAVRMQYALPLGMVWAFLGLTRLISNSLGTEGHGIQFYFLSPTPLRTVVLGKNALHLVLFLLEALLITVVVVVRFGAPSPSVAAVAIAWMLFAVPANFAAGNALSIAMPYRVNMARMSREQGALGNGLLSMLTQFGIVAVGALVIVPCAVFGRQWIAVPILLLVAAAGLVVYWRVLANVDRMVGARMESLTRDIAKATPAG